jgi:autophagy-related protein 2
VNNLQTATFVARMHTCLLLSQGFRGTAENLARVAYEEHMQKGLTGAVGGVLRQLPPTVLHPVIIATEATSNLLGGMRNQLLPDKKKEEEEKWKIEDD